MPVKINMTSIPMTQQNNHRSKLMCLKSRNFTGEFLWKKSLPVALCLVLISFFDSFSNGLFQETSLFGQGISQTPEDISGSMKDLNSLRLMNKDYTRSPDGQALPASEDDLWLPNMSLTNDSRKKTAATPIKAEGTSIKTAPQTTSGTPNTVPTSIGSVTTSVPKPDTTPVKVAAAAGFNPGFQVGTSKKETLIPPNPPETQQNQLLTQTLQNGNGYQTPTTTTMPISTNPGALTPYTLPLPPNVTNTTGANNTSHEGFAFSNSQNYSSIPTVNAVNNNAVNNNVQNNQPVMNQQIMTNGGMTNGGMSQVNVPISQIPQVPQVPVMPQTSVINTINKSNQVNNQVNNTNISRNVQSSPLPQNNANWEAPFSKPGQKGRPMDVVQSEKEGILEDLSEHIINDIRVSGLEMSITKFNKLIKTKIGNKFSQQLLEEDKRALLQTKQFIDVTVSTTLLQDQPNKVVVNFDLTPRRLMQYILIIGNKKISKSVILEELGMKRGESRLDPYDVENGRIRIIELYKNKGYSEPYVEVLKGSRPEDIGVVYFVDDGVKQRILKTSFTGNTITSSGHLKTLITSKPGIFYLIGGDFNRAVLDEDVGKLLEYYRKLGFFDAQVDREFEECKGYTGLGKKNGWVKINYLINEGPRYKIRNVYYDGNKILQKWQLEAKSKLKKNDYYNQLCIEEDRVVMKNQYHQMGYVLADIQATQIITDEPGYLDIRFKIDEKKRYRVKDIVINYNGTEARTKSTVILNMLDISPGELLYGDKIKMSETTLRRSGYFNDKPTDGVLPTIKIIPDSDKPLQIEKKMEMAPERTAKKKSGIFRGQTRQMPTGFNNTTTSPYISYTGSANELPGTITDMVLNNQTVGQSTTNRQGNTTSLNASPYTQNGGNNVSQQQVKTASTQTGTGTSYSNGIPSYNSMTPGFNAMGAAGVDPAFSGTPQQQYLNNQLSGTLQTEPTDSIGNATVVADIMEGRTGVIQASIGVNSDYGLIGNVGLTERNFDIARWPKSLWRADGWTDAFRGGGQIFNIQASPGTSIQRYTASWDVPYVLNTNYTFGLTGMYGDRSYTEWFETRIGGEVRLGKQWTPRFSTTLTGSGYNVKISDPYVTFVPDLNNVLGNNSMYTIGLGASYDRRNHPFLPSEGGVLKGNAEYVTGDYNYPRFSIDARKYFKLHERFDRTGQWILGLSAKAGWSGDNTPIYERYYGGGSTNLRGFEYREVTPRFPGTTFGVGGNFEFYTSTELLVPVSGGDEFMLAFFLDTGTVSENIKNWDSYRVAPGFGFRISIPMLGPAPLALDFAFPVSKSDNDRTQVFSFTITGSR